MYRLSDNLIERFNWILYDILDYPICPVCHNKSIKYDSGLRKKLQNISIPSRKAPSGAFPQTCSKENEQWEIAIFWFVLCSICFGCRNGLHVSDVQLGEHIFLRLYLMEI